MIKPSECPRRNRATLISTAALMLLLPGCEKFWRVQKPVTTSPGQHPGMVQPPTGPAPLPPVLPEPEPQAEPQPEPGPPPKPAPGPRPTAIMVPGKPGFVFSPYNNKVIDVQGFNSGTLVADPTYPMSERKFFRVP